MDNERRGILMKRFENVQNLLECCNLALKGIDPEIDPVIEVIKQAIALISHLETDTIHTRE
jgi:hypothetical protein